KGVKRVHGLATLDRQEMHCPGERAASSCRAQRNRAVLIEGCGDGRIPARAPRKPRAKTFYGVHCNSLRDSDVNRYGQDGSIVSQSGAASVRPSVGCSVLAVALGCGNGSI